MAITPTTGTTSSVQQASAPAKSLISNDFNMFLKLLTTQMQNQDPLSPMDSTQYTQQLVQYSQVEQSVQQNGTLKDILSSLSNQNIAQAAGFIGRDAEFSSSVSGLGAKPASWTYTADRAIASVTATISDASGKTVFTGPITLSGTSGSYSWDGSLADGSRAANGAYTLALKALDTTGANVATAISTTGTVEGVDAKGGALSLSVNGALMPMNLLTRLVASGS